MAEQPYQSFQSPRLTSHTAMTIPIANATQERTVVENQSNQNIMSVKLASLRQLFRFADSSDYFLIVIGIISAAASGVAQPIQIILFGDVLNAFNPKASQPGDNIVDSIDVVALRFVYLGIAVIIVGFLYVFAWSLTASRQVRRIRAAYVEAIITKEMGWFDVTDPMKLSTQVADSTILIHAGIGRKLGDGVNFASMAISGVVIGLIKGWDLALVLLAFTPIIAASAYFFMRVLAQATQSGIDSYSKAGAIAEEAISNVKTVYAFNAGNIFVNKYAKLLDLTTAAGIKKGSAIGFGTGLMFFSIFCTYACGMYYGAVRVSDDQLEGRSCTGNGCYDGGKVLTVFFGVIMGAMALGQAGPSLQAFYGARAAAYDVFRVIDLASKINPLQNDGEKLEKVTGRIEIKDIKFAYPSRPDTCVCKNYSLTIEAGETVALVGPSGSGKSTIVALLERFYDPLRGSVLLDGRDIRELNVRWLREQVGLVGQEPTLFATSILENIRTGFPAATDEQVFGAAKMANAYDFIMEFPQGFQTDVGERGAQLSGGQKQRIAIARAILKNPPILLLDEATSALDTESERIVQESLDKLVASSKRTTIIIAHRLSTIRDANRIAVHNSGNIVELGHHSELMKIENGHYRSLVDAEDRKQREEKETVAVDFKTTPVSEYTADDIDQTESVKGAHEQVNKSDADKSELRVESAKTEMASVSVRRIWKMSAPEWKYITLGCVFGCISSAAFPIWGVLLVKIVTLFFNYDYTRDEMRDDARWYSLGFVALGIIFAIAIVLQNYGFAVSTQRLIARIRLMTFQSMLRQEVGWFDLDENTSGALVSRLATDSGIIQTLTSGTLNQVIVNLCSLGVGFIISFIYSWQMTLVVLATTPVLVAAALIRSKMMTGGNEEKSNDADSLAGSLLSETIGSIRTVASFTMEESINARYKKLLDASSDAVIRAGSVGGLAYGISQGTNFMNLALLFHVGGVWVSNGTITFEEMFMVQMVIILSTFASGMTVQDAGDSSKVKGAASRIFAIIDRVPTIILDPTEGDTADRVRGEIEFLNVAFRYPARPEAMIYKNYSLKIAEGQTVALVGASGSGKSTAISLVERFYDPNSGGILLDGEDLRSYNVPWLRERISLVGQEPVLFAGTIAENISMGKIDATREEIVEAAKSANAHDFISKFPNGYDTDVGDRGAQVSGGQKQRIALARAIIRDPDVLLLDEATSALDNESERIVQDSLDRLLATKRRTTIIVAHRLSTIRNADLIAVTQNGEIVEQGTHNQLIELPNGIYKALVARQMGGSN